MNRLDGHRLPKDCGLPASPRCPVGKVLGPRAPGGVPQVNPLLRPGQPGSISPSQHMDCFFTNIPFMLLPNSDFNSSSLLYPNPFYSRRPCSSDPVRQLSGCNPTTIPLLQQATTNGNLLCPRMPFKLACHNVRTLMRVGQQSGLARTLDTLAIDVCCLSETRIQDSSSVVRLTSPGPSKGLFYLRLSGDPVASVAGQAGVGVALSAKAEAALQEWIPVSSRLCAVRLRGS